MLSRGDFEDAENAYTAGINAATAEYSKVMDTGMSEKKARVVTPGVSILLCNRSLMKSKLGDYQGALDDANEAIRAVLDGDVNYVKALLRKADALKKQEKFSDAFEAYFLCWTRLPGDANIANELNECVEKSERPNKKKLQSNRRAESMFRYERIQRFDSKSRVSARRFSREVVRSVQTNCPGVRGHEFKQVPQRSISKGGRRRSAKISRREKKFKPCQLLFSTDTV